MFPLPRPPSPRQRSTSCSTDDHSSTRDKPRRLFQRYYPHDLTMSSHSLANSVHDDLPTPSMPTHASHSTSTQSTPMTSPSTGYSSLFPGSLSSATSESAPSAESKYRSEFGMLIPGPSSPYSAIHGSTSSRSSNPVSPWSRSPTESDPQTSAPRVPSKRPSGSFSSRPGTAPNSPPMFATPNSVDRSPVDHHTRSHSRLTVSIKNIFSRHTAPSPSRFSFNSATTTPPESEASSSSFHAPVATGKWTMTPRKSRPPDLEISGTVTPAIPSPGRGSNTSIDAHRRYASEAVAKIYNARTGSGCLASQENIDVSFRNVTPVRGKDPKTRNVLRRRPSGSAKLFKGRERGMSSPIRPNEGDADQLGFLSKDGISRQGGVPFPLTPAGAVVEAYKQQELHRDDTPSPPKLSIDDQMSSKTSHDGGYDRDPPEHSPTPYYTVFGSAADRRIQAGGPDDRWTKFEAGQRIFPPSQPTLSHQPSMSDPGGRSLTRKLSSRWRKVKGGGVVEDSPLRDKGHSKGRPSLQDIWGNDKSSPRTTGRSMDIVPNPADGAWASPTVGHARSGSKSEKSEGGPKLWQLMRRISTGGLRDRFQSDNAVPPVPAIPKELLKKAYQGERNETSRHKLSSSSPTKDQSRTFSSSRNIASVISSSPNSSDVASTQFFQRSRSPRSSVSSYGEAVVAPRAPDKMLDRHIITPLEQLRLADDHGKSCESSLPTLPAPRSPRRVTSVPVGLRTVEDAEPLLPRRQTSSGESSRPCSTSPSASARGSYQNSGALGQSRMADGIVSLSPPPRPMRNSSRGGVGMASSPSHSMVVRPADGSVGVEIGGVRQIDRQPSGQSDMTARVESPEPEPEPGRSLRRDGRDRDRDRNRDRDAPQAQTKFTFRKLDTPRRPPLTEREKTDIWNDLLARSDKAGGTLHINSAMGLMSDNMRLSTHSEV